jgi:hypothetical protein
VAPVLTNAGKWVVGLALAALAGSGAQAQGISFTNELDSTGRAGSVSRTWKIDPLKGSYVYLCYRAASPLPQAKLYVFVDREAGPGEFKEFDTKKVDLGQPRPWAALRYLFAEEGRYLVSFADPERQVLARDTIAVVYRTNLLFAEALGPQNSRPLAHAARFKLGRDGTKALYTYLLRSAPFQSRVLVCEIYYYDGNGYDEKYAADRFTVQPYWKEAHFKHVFDKPGNYLVVVLDDQRRVLGREYLSLELP